MVCYAVPLAAAATLSVCRRSSASSWLRSAQGFWLNIMMLGGAVFGLVDHLFAGELFVLTSAWMTDMLIGGAITAGIAGCWGVLVLSRRFSGSLPIQVTGAAASPASYKTSME